MYNVAAYLRQCLDSLLGQTYKDIEIIVVNDGSTDNSGTICDEYAARDTRIAVIHKKNGGVSSARNLALERMTGECLMFVDSDDWIDAETCSSCLHVMHHHAADVVLFPYTREFAGQGTPRHLFSGNQEWIGSAVQRTLQRRMIGLLDDELRNPETADSLGVIWGKLYRVEIIKTHHLHFVDLAQIGSYEDGLFNLQVFQHAQKAVYLDQCHYHYRKTNTHSVTNQYRPRLHDQWNQLFYCMTEFIRTNGLGSEFQKALNNRIALSMIGLGLNECSPSNPKNAFQRISSLHQFTSEDRYTKAIRTLQISILPLKWKLFFLCCRYRFTPGLYALLCIMREILRRR